VERQGLSQLVQEARKRIRLFGKRLERVLPMGRKGHWEISSGVSM
jgi:hypothetical protein